MIEPAQKEQQREYQRAWRAKNLDKERARCRNWRAANKERENARTRKWFEENPGYRANYRLRSKYGITLEDKEALLREQGGRCAICRSDDPASGTGWHLDHCHGSNRVRGVLCAPCNIMLGGAKDNEETLVKAAAYIAQHKALV